MIDGLGLQNPGAEEQVWAATMTKLYEKYGLDLITRVGIFEARHLVCDRFGQEKKRNPGLVAICMDVANRKGQETTSRKASRKTSTARSCKLPLCKETYRVDHAFCQYHRNVKEFRCEEISGLKIGGFHRFKDGGFHKGYGYILAMEADYKNEADVMHGPGQIFFHPEEESPQVNKIVSFYRKHKPAFATHTHATGLLKQHKGNLTKISNLMMKEYGVGLDGTKARPAPNRASQTNASRQSKTKTQRPSWY
jgi:hypothetical protein